jgi:hypothetical protein
LNRSKFAETCTREVIELHLFFEGWLGGSLPATEEVFARFVDATAPDFILIGPEGTIATAEQTAAWIRAAHGTRQGFRLWTDEHLLRAAGDDWALMTYREWQTREGATTVRLSTALFCVDPAAPRGLRWQHVHETWLASSI